MLSSSMASNPETLSGPLHATLSHQPEAGLGVQISGNTAAPPLPAAPAPHMQAEGWHGATGAYVVLNVNFRDADNLHILVGPGRSRLLGSYLIMALHGISWHLLASSPVIHGVFVVAREGLIVGKRQSVTREQLDALFQFLTVVSPYRWEHGLAKVGDLMLSATPAQMVAHYGLWRIYQLRPIAVNHRVQILATANITDVLHALSSHTCVADCPREEYLFRILKHPRPARRKTQVMHAAVEATASSSPAPSEHSANLRMTEPRSVQSTFTSDNNEFEYLSIPSDDLKRSIIAEWELAMTTSNIKETVCAVCARRTPPSHIHAVPPD
ncbi:hypothetical protein NUW54_g948 [Trametes sanguinea]|uniref:Uncharacterized protein n=1 Tax=Trametes sanguinea TaxID=158606 RepID=A0ACC1QAX0_9APHY|nr:hypothetical protein NUW54_g948 [Trametes sanguinea]